MRHVVALKLIHATRYKEIVMAILSRVFIGRNEGHLSPVQTDGFTSPVDSFFDWDSEMHASVVYTDMFRDNTLYSSMWDIDMACVEWIVVHAAPFMTARERTKCRAYVLRAISILPCTMELDDILLLNIDLFIHSRERPPKHKTLEIHRSSPCVVPTTPRTETTGLPSFLCISSDSDE